jgi:Na+/H+ antiporter
MIWTTFPSIVIALILFTVIGFNIYTSNTSSNLEITLQLLSENFSINVFMLVPVIMLLIMANKKFPPIPTILTGVILGILIALIFQQGAISSLSGETESNALTLFKGIWITLFDGFALNSGNDTLDNLMTRGGMSSMLSTVWLGLCAMVFGGVMEKTGLLQRLVDHALSFAHNTGTLIATPIATCIGANIITPRPVYFQSVLPGTHE